MSAEPLSATAPIEHKLPEGWREVPLASVAEVRFSGVNKLSLPSEKPVRLCNYTDVYNNDYITGDLEFMRATATQPEINRFGLQLGDVIITKDSETPDDIGIAAVVDYTAPDLLCGYHLALIRPRTEEADPTFLAKQLRHHRLARYFGQRANGLTRYGLPTAVVANAPLWLPEPAKQRAIGALLRLVDEAIAKTEAVVVKLKQVRAGLLHDLLTRGLDEHRQLREAIAQPEAFRATAAGVFPADWDVRPLGKVLSAVFDYRGRTPLKLGMEWGGGDIPALSANNVEMGRINFEKETYFGSDELYRHWMTNGDTEPGDVLITMEAPLGNIAQIPDDKRYILSQRVVLLRPHRGFLTKDFLALQMMGEQFQRELVRNSTGTTAVGIQRAKLELILVAVPRSMQEQQNIADTMHSLDSEISAASSELSKLQQLKSGLMTDLLTGRVRVPETVSSWEERA